MCLYFKNILGRFLLKDYFAKCIKLILEFVIINLGLVKTEWGSNFV